MLPIVWLLGTSGVGKSTTGYRLLSELDASRVRAGFVDADQLRLASRVWASETELIASALPALSRVYREHGAQVLIVAGLADDHDHMARLLPGVPRDRVFAVHLYADGDTIRERVRRRGWLVDLADDAVDYAARIDHCLADLRLDTTAKSPAQLAAQVGEATRAHIGRVAPERFDIQAANDKTTVPRSVVAITGPGGVGVSTAGFQTFSQLAHSGEPVGYIDAHQLGFDGTRGEHLASLRADNSRAVADNLASGGAETVVVSADAHTMGILANVWDETTVTRGFWLHANANSLAERITARSRGGGPPIQGNRRLGSTGPELSAAITTAVSESEQDDLQPAQTQIIDTTDLDPAQVAETIIASLEKPSGGQS